MYNIIFYEDKNGKSDTYEYIKELHRRNDKNSRINFTKIAAYINILAEMGNNAGYPFMKHIEGDIWELRPLRNRIFYAYCDGNTFVILHHFIKKTQKTPRREIERAKENLNDYLIRK